MANENAKMNKDKLLHSLKNVVNGEITLKKKISLDAWIELKKAVYPINNYITTELTIKFIDKLKLIFKNTRNVKGKLFLNDLKALKEYYGKINVNANGYDFIAPVPVPEKTTKKDVIKIPELSKSFPHITAEIKANIPYNEKKYGSSQKTGLINDAKKLSTQKPSYDPTNDYKFLVVLDYNFDDYDSKNAVDDLIRILNGPKANKVEEVEKIKKVEIVNLDNPPKITKGKIYIVMLGIND